MTVYKCFIHDFTWRELFAIYFALKSFYLHHRMQYLIWETDNYATSLIVASGSKKSQLRNLVFADHKYKHYVYVTIIARFYNKRMALYKINHFSNIYTYFFLVILVFIFYKNAENYWILARSLEISQNSILAPMFSTYCLYVNEKA